MERFEKIFYNFPVILPVIHVESLDQALRNTHIARQQKCDGVFLINHGLPHTALLDIHHKLFKEFPDWWIGINCLDLYPWELFDMITDEVAGVWADNAYIDERAEHQQDAESISAARQKSGWGGLYFGGVAFKFQRAVDDPGRAATLARNYMDVVTTSGPGTGRAANISKIETMKGSIGTFPLAIASGISPENVHLYAGISDCFLVATGISKSWTELDPKLVKTLVSKVKVAYRQNL
jgi:hypothetical protein